jgi:hypothetical protein
MIANCLHPVLYSATIHFTLYLSSVSVLMPLCQHPAEAEASVLLSESLPRVIVELRKW